MDYCTESPVLLRGVNKKCDEDGLRWDRSIFRLIRELPLQSYSLYEQSASFDEEEWYRGVG